MRHSFHTHIIRSPIARTPMHLSIYIWSQSPRLCHGMDWRRCTRKRRKEEKVNKVGNTMARGNNMESKRKLNTCRQRKIGSCSGRGRTHTLTLRARLFGIKDVYYWTMEWSGWRCESEDRMKAKWMEITIVWAKNMSFVIAAMMCTAKRVNQSVCSTSK